MDRKSQTIPRKPPLQTLLPVFLILAAIPGMVKIASQIIAWRTISHPAALGDGLNYWAGPFLARQSVAAVFNPPVYSTWLATHLAVKNLIWSYPPSFLLLLYPLGFLPPVAAVFLFDIMSLAVLAFALESTSFFQKRSSSLLPLLFCPAALENLADSQNGALISALLIAGLKLEAENALLAGVLLGLLSVKPQIALLVPVYLLARRNFRALAAAAAAALALAGAALACFGAAAWQGFFQAVAPAMSAGLVYMTHTPHPGPQAMMMSVFNLARECGAPVKISYAVQLVAAVVAMGLTWRAARMGPEFRIAAVLLLSAVATPYLWCYDMIFTAYAAVLLAPVALERGRGGEGLLLAGLWLTPGLAVYLEILHLPSLFPLFAVGALAIAWRRASIPTPGSFAAAAA
jgi:hypothetical protein